MYYGYNENELLCGSPNRETVVKLCTDLGYPDAEITTVEKPKNIPLADVKTNKIAELKSARDKAEQEPVQTEKGVFDVDDKSITRISNAILVLEKTGLTLDWTLADNTIAEVKAIDLQNVIMALAKQSNEVHEKYRTLKECVEKAATAEDVNAIVWDDVEPVEEVLPE